MQPTKKSATPILWLMVFTSAIGFFDALYLTIKHYTNTLPACSIFTGCEVVTTSKWSLMFGIPVSLLGLLYYVSIIALAIFLLHKKNNLVKKILCYWPITGFIFSLWFIGLQAFVIHAFCLYCLASAASSTALFLFGLLLKRRK